MSGLTAGAIVGASTAVGPDRAAVYAENIATNVRQAIAVISNGDQATANNMLAQARSGVQAVTSNATGSPVLPGTVIQVLRDNVALQLAGIITPAEFVAAGVSRPVVVPNPPPVLVPVPQREPVQENPSRDVVSPT